MCNNLPLRKGAGEFMCPMVPTLPARGSFEQHISEVDETKNFRGEETLEDIVETARSSDHTVKSANTEALMRITSNKRYLSTTMLQSDDSDNDNNGYVTTCECLSKAISNENVLKDAGPVRTSLWCQCNFNRLECPAFLCHDASAPNAFGLVQHPHTIETRKNASSFWW